MRKGFLISFVSLAFAAGVASAQEPPVLSDQLKKDHSIIKTPEQITKMPELGPQPLGESDIKSEDGKVHTYQPDGSWVQCMEPQACGTNCWGSIEYLLWWITDGPVPPLVTTGNPQDGPLAGTLGQPATRVLFGSPALDYDRLSGVRLTLGGWLDCDRSHGFEISGFVLERGSSQFNGRSDNTGNPPLYVPGFNVVTQREDSLIVSDPLQRFAGTVQWESNSQFWGLEANGLYGVHRNCGCEVAVLTGLRYLDLQESLQLNNTTNDLDNDVTDSLVDRFDTRNQFFGPQIGARVSYRHCSWTADLTGKIAMGGARRVVNVTGQITETGEDAPTPGTFPGGFFTQPSNIGRQSHTEFAIVPEVEVKVGYDICSCLRAYVGYDVIFMNETVRPGNQIDRNLNLNQSPVFNQGNFGPASQPRQQFNPSDFWAHGVTFGLELRY